MLTALTILRREQHLTQTQLAAKIGISQAELSLYETGQKRAPQYVIDALQKEFPQVSNGKDLFLAYVKFLKKIGAFK
jgi:transcriptional regulator with XRE-family HTH domain